MGSRSLARAQLEAVAAPTLVSLRNVTSETALLARPVAGGRVFVAQFESVHEMHMKADLGTVFPWYAGASGKAMLAYLDEPMQEQILELAKGEDGLSEQRVVELSAELEMIRALGYAVSIGDPNSLAAAVAAPVVDPNGTLVAAISVCAPIARFSSHMLTERASLVIRAANEVSRRMQLMAS